MSNHQMTQTILDHIVETIRLVNITLLRLQRIIQLAHYQIHYLHIRSILLLTKQRKKKILTKEKKKKKKKKYENRMNFIAWGWKELRGSFLVVKKKSNMNQENTS